ncbi:MAG: M20/M25/M40 family metallo-hydrolase [Anaerolineales bacterium]
MQHLQQTMQAWMPDFITDLGWLVSHDRGYMHKPGVDVAVEWMRSQLEALGCAIQTVTSESTGNLVTGTLRGHGQGRYLLLAHLDTVWPEGTAVRWPLAIDGHIARGPGAWDNANGSLTGLYVLKALRQLEYADFGEVTLLCNGDEELGSLFSGDIIRQVARGHDAAFCLEAPTRADEFVGQRGGSMGCTLRVTGQRAHSQMGGGANAIVELSHKIMAAERLKREGVWVLPVTSRGGTQSGMVPDEAEALFDVSFLKMDDVDFVERGFKEIAAHTTVPGTATELSTILYHPSQERLPGTARLSTLAQSIGREMGIELKDVFSSGVADGSFASAEGVPTLCGLTATGGAAHTRNEWLDLSQVALRVSLVAGLVMACVAEK